MSIGKPGIRCPGTYRMQQRTRRHQSRRNAYIAEGQWTDSLKARFGNNPPRSAHPSAVQVENPPLRPGVRPTGNSFFFKCLVNLYCSSLDQSTGKWIKAFSFPHRSVARGKTTDMFPGKFLTQEAVKSEREGSSRVRLLRDGQKPPSFPPHRDI
jgi:hypothetical protein